VSGLRYICVHGHFYQPPRENPWLEEVEYQESATPYHDWNERITDECYRPNGWSRIVDPEGFITQIRSNYARISFDFASTLLTWLELKAPDVYDAVLRAERESRERFGGHSSALAQSYHHTILPLASEADKRTQVRWGVFDYRRRFGHDPEGLWLPETAVDRETLGVLAEEGIRYTVLAPRQAARYRPLGEAPWTDAAAAGVPPTRPYLVRGLPGGREIAVFFYDGPISQAVAFGGLLDDGAAFAERIFEGFTSAADTEDELAHIATDGETYGHHHRFGDMALAFALTRIEQEGRARLTNYGQYLAEHPPAWEAEVLDNTSWSCAHGVERWRSNCGCNSGAHPGWQQAWRGPLREAINRLRDTLHPRFLTEIGALVKDAAAARDDYVDIFGRWDRERVDAYLARHAVRYLSEAETTRLLELLELERHLQQAYTSCGWFFDDIGGIESVQVLQYAARAIQLAERLFGSPVEEEFTRTLAAARGNVPPNVTGDAIYRRLAAPVRIDLKDVCAHYALSSLFENYDERARLFCYEIDRTDRRLLMAGGARFVVGRATVRSRVTRESGAFTYGALYIGGHSLYGGVRPFRGEAAYADTARRLTEAFDQGDLARSVKLVDEHFGSGTYSLRLLFRDEQRRIVDLLLESTRRAVEGSFRQIYETTAPVLRYLAESSSPAPRSLRAATEYYANLEAQRALERDPPDPTATAGWLHEMERMHLNPDRAALGFAWARATERLMDRLAQAPEEGTLHLLNQMADLLGSGQFEPDLTRVQERYYFLRESPVAEKLRTTNGGPGGERPMHESFRALGRKLKVRTE
jgi:hypothetical protein